MTTPRNGPVPESMGDWMRGQEKRVMHEERRARITKASDLLGPGFGPTATALLDWNAEDARFNGFFYSEGDADNVPVPGYMHWMGLTISTGTHTMQMLWSHGAGEVLVFKRQIHVHANQMPTFGAWEALGGGTGGSTLLSELLDVALAGVADGEFLKYDSGTWINAALTKADITDFTHIHDDRYYTETEVDTALAGKSDTGHTHTKAQITDFAHTHSLTDLTAGILSVPLVMDEQPPPPVPAPGTGAWWTGEDGRPHFMNDEGDVMNLDPITGSVPTEPPAASPEIEVTGGPSALIVRTMEVVDSFTLLQYQIAPDVAGAPGAWEDFGDPTRSAVMLIGTLPSTGDPLVLGSTYWVRVQATNGIAPDPAPSTEKSGTLNANAIAEAVFQMLVAGFILAGQIQVGTTGGGITIHPDTGIRIPQPGNKFIVFPTDGSRAKIEGAGAELDSLKVIGLSELATTMLSGTGTMNAGVTTPTAAPAIEEGWPRLTPTTAFIGGWFTQGLADGGTEWLTTGNVGGTYGVYGIDKTSGAVTLRKAVALAGGVTKIGTKFFVLNEATVAGQWYYQVRRYDSSWVEEALIYNQLQSTHRVRALGTDGTDLLMLGYVSSPVKVRHYDTSGALLTTVNLDSSAIIGNSIVGGAADFGGYRYVIGHSSSGDMRVHLSTGARSSGDEFPLAGPGPYGGRGLHWDGTRFWGIDEAGNIYQHSTVLTTHGTVTASQTLTDGAAETAASPASSPSIVRRPRAYVKVTAMTPPTSPSGLYSKVYIANGATRRLATVTPALSNTNLAGYVQAFSGVAAVEPTVLSGTFAAGGVGKWAASSGGFEINGSSNGSVGTGTFRDSILTAVQTGGDTWHTVGAAGEPAFVSPWSAQSESVQFSKDPAGNIHIRGRMARGTAASGSVVFVLPAGYRPVAQNVDGLAVAGQGSAVGNARIDTDGSVRVFWTTSGNWFGPPAPFRP